MEKEDEERAVSCSLLVVGSEWVGVDLPGGGDEAGGDGAGAGRVWYNGIMENAQMDDPRNLRDEFKGLTNEQVFDALSEKRMDLEVAIENVTHDFNAGTIVRSANNFNVARVHIIGKRKYNRRGAMCTDKYLEVIYWPTVEEFYTDQQGRNREVVAIENNTERAKPLAVKKFVQETTLLFGGESDGLSAEALRMADDVREIESFGSTRSVNVGVAAGIAMYEWARQCVLGGSNGEDIRGAGIGEVSGGKNE